MGSIAQSSTRSSGAAIFHRWQAAGLRRRRRFVSLIVGLCLVTISGLVGATPASAAIQDGRVLPASALVHGWTLDRAVQATFAWNTGDRTAPPPKTPFQILFVQGDGHTSYPGNGQVVRNSRAFQVPAGTAFFLPVAYNNDVPPVVGTFPTTHSRALGYWYDQAQLGTRFASISIDGRSTPLSHDYLVGPLRQPGSNIHLVEEAALISALPKGHHVVTVSFTWAGALIKGAFGTTFYTFEGTFPITVG